ncbi:NADP-dependent isocitrate dehydrogenase [Secundilactobacillus collinoides]|uniref:Isocitrate dehydrogenase [NADP] n=2 Tax=Secundilactobacillus collinoides TaxID=33960 RepID=A0A0R2B9S6_SECCO|nr:NADP-dependent isocitrate dehydrogenase [Secundilactobacillus collinoides]KRM73291.1 isocitrate dehydrogenase (NADP(+)) [Secundilactobacillus collinoides DSM 20515 = JCM 1123]KZL42450.1 isocitrate dehydrogenase [Secundilactobacillus collinoides]
MTPSKITFNSGKLNVPDNPIIPFIEGDGIGPEIWGAAKTVFDTAVQTAFQGNKAVSWLPLLAGETAHKKTGQWLPDETLTALRENRVGIKGPLTTPIGHGHRSINVTLRQKLDLYACFRPVTYYPGTPSPVVHPEKVDIDVFRENTEDIYAGIDTPGGTPEAKEWQDLLAKQGQLDKVRFPETAAYAIKPISKEGSTRLVKAALDYALTNNKHIVTLVHKGNIMKKTEGAFKQWGYELADSYDETFTMAEYDRIKADEGSATADAKLAEAKEAGKIIVNDVITDNFFQQALLYPDHFQIVATMNLNGDYISDALAAQVGGIGIAPGGNINYQTGHAVFEATHGTAPQFAGQNKLNPTSLMLSGAMMFDYLGWHQVADLIRDGIKQAIATHHVTEDFAQDDTATVLGTSQFGDYVAGLITNAVKA